jgi:lipopolysaccharide export LptBFGC system permease protein LptF
MLVAPAGRISGTVERGNLMMTLNFGSSISPAPERGELSMLRFQEARIDLIRLFKNKIFNSDDDQDDYRGFYPLKLWKHLDVLKKAPKKKLKHYYRASYLFHNRLASPFAIIAFAMFALVIGIQDARHGRSRAYVGGISVILVGYIFMTAAKWFAERGYVHGFLAAWIPQLLLLALAAFLLYQRSRLPITESTLNPKNFPWKRPKSATI